MGAPRACGTFAAAVEGSLLPRSRLLAPLLACAAAAS